MSRSCVSMVVFHLTLKLWTRFVPLNATRRFPTKEPSAILCGQTPKMWTPGLLAHVVQAGCLAPRLQTRYTISSNNHWRAIKETVYLYQQFYLSNVCFVLVRAHQQLEAHLPCTSAGSWRLQVHVWWKAGDCVVSTELLLPLWKHCIHHGLQGCQQTRTQAVPCCSWLWARHTTSNNHPILPLTSPPSISSQLCGDLKFDIYLYAK